MKSEWKTVTVKDVLYTTDYVANGSFAALKNNVTYLEAKDYAVLIRLVDFNNNWNGPFVYVNKDSYNFLKKSYVEHKDVIISNVGANVGTVFQAPNLNMPMTLGPNSVLIKPDNEDVDRDYIYYFFTSSVGQGKLFAIVSGSAQPKFNKTGLRNIKLPLPPLPIQKKIAHILSTLDDKIELNRKMNKTLEAMAQALFKSWFVDFDPVHAKAQAKSEQELEVAASKLDISKEILDLFPSEFEESEMGMIPLGWAYDTLSNHILVTKGKSYKSSELQESRTALVTLKSFLRGGGYRTDGVKPYTGKYKDEQVIQPGELIMAYTDVTQDADVIGKPAIVLPDEAIDILVASLDVGIVRTKTQKINIMFLYHLFKTKRFQGYILGHTSGTTVLHLAKGWLDGYNILLPSQEIMNRYNKLVSSLFNKLRLNIEEIRSLQKTRDTLLPKLLSGELDVSNINIGRDDAEKM